MSIVSYILTSVLLSLLGCGVYLLYRWLHPAPKGRRLMAWLVIVSSLTIPFSPRIGGFSGTHGPETSATHGALGHIPPAGQTINEFCHCTEPQTSDIIFYQASRIYDVLLANAAFIGLLLALTTAFFLLRHSLRIIKLHRMVRRAQPEHIVIQGIRIRLVRGNHAPGALRLFGKYIFWNDQLDQIPEADRQAILLHELSHIRQHNTLEKILLSAIQGLWFFNPALYFFKSELELLSEYNADAYAAQHSPSRKRYAHLLLNIHSQAQFAFGHFFKGSRISKRIAYLLGKQRPRKLPLLPAALIGLGLLFSTEIYAQATIQDSLHEMEMYEFMTRTNQETGQQEFCVKCTEEAIECQ